MSDKREREKRRELRQQEEAEAQGRERRKRLVQLGSGGAVLAIVVVAVLILISQSGSGGGGGDASNIGSVSSVDSLLNGIPQKGTVLGDPSAKTRLIEYGDLQCPVCKEYSEQIVPQVIDSQVRNGKATIDFRNYVIIGPQSKPAGAAALAAGEQGRGWNFIELFYRNQGEENSGYATSAFLTSVAKAAGVPDIAKWNTDRDSAHLKNEVSRTTAEAQQLGFDGTPSFLVKGPNGSNPLGTPGSAGAIETAISAGGG